MKKLAMAAMVLALTAPQAQAADSFAKQRAEWNKPMKPFHVIDNIYYVGTAGVSSFLIFTLQGFILTDGGLPESAKQIEANIKTLGFDIKDVKIILNGHAHFDHAGGLAKLKRDSGAKLIASAADKPILERGRISFGPSATDPFPPVKVDRAVKDGDTVDLGGVTLTAHVTPGHTPGCTDWTMPIVAGGQEHTVIFFCSLTVAGNPLVNNKAYPTIAADYKASFARLKKIDADIFLAPHGEQFGLAKKVATLEANKKNKVMNAPNPFIDKAEFHRVVGQMEKDFNVQLAKQQAAAKKGEPQAKR
jgi:metallo-beta-lactamase class B